MMTYNLEHLFIFLFGICICSLMRCLLRYLFQFKIKLFIFLLLRFKSSLYILNSSPLSDVSFANTFSQSMACLFILLTLSLAEQKCLILLKSSLSMIFFWDSAFVIVTKKASPYPRSSRFSPVLSSWNFIVLCFTFRCLIHFELIFVKGVRSVLVFFFP